MKIDIIQNEPMNNNLSLLFTINPSVAELQSEDDETLRISVKSMPCNINAEFNLLYSEDFNRELIDLISDSISRWGYRCRWKVQPREEWNDSVEIQVDETIYTKSDKVTPISDLYKLNAKINEMYRKIINYGRKG